ncbi:hypothetical protein GW17_00035122 [Ensete ventricosum]|nr:hypothetical protein GW17_00035122 [Ensete ventricosum]
MMYDLPSLRYRVYGVLYRCGHCSLHFCEAMKLSFQRVTVDPAPVSLIPELCHLPTNNLHCFAILTPALIPVSGFAIDLAT